MLADLVSSLTIVASIATAVGVFLAWWQIREASRQSITTFEDSLDRQYRDICERLPVMALLGEDLAQADYDANLGHLYSYIDLSNQQISLRQQNRVRKATWDNWCDGIAGNLERPAFKRAWAEIRERAKTSFGELRRLEKDRFSSDPLSWTAESMQGGETPSASAPPTPERRA